MARRANILAILRGINHIMRDFLCRHTVRMIITTIINIIMCPTFPSSSFLLLLLLLLHVSIVIAIIYKIRARARCAFMR